MTTFKELGIKKYWQNLEKLGITKPFPIQEESIPILIEGKDVIGQSQTGTGKTAAFGLPILENIDSENKNTQSLIIVPTRELANQISDELKKLSGWEIGIASIYGGVNMLKQIRLMRTNRQIIVATPGRLIDFLKDDLISLKKIRFVVLDEADRMLDMGFIKDIKYILNKLPKEKQMCIFSATMNKQVINLSQEFLNNPKKIIVSKDEISNVKIKQYWMKVSSKEKLNQLCDILEKEKLKTIVFCSSKIRSVELTESLYKRGFEIDLIQGDMEQKHRNRVINDFKNHNSNILIATDVIARGIDVPKVDCIINFDVPKDKTTYFHRIGRTARADEKGISILFVTKDYMNYFREIKQETKIKIEEIGMVKTKEFPIIRELDKEKFGRIFKISNRKHKFRNNNSKFKKNFNSNNRNRKKHFGIKRNR